MKVVILVVFSMTNLAVKYQLAKCLTKSKFPFLLQQSHFEFEKIQINQNYEFLNMSVSSLIGQDQVNYLNFSMNLMQSCLNMRVRFFDH